MLKQSTNRFGRSSADVSDCIVVADDNPELLSALEYMITGEELVVHTAPDGLSALQLCRRLHPRVVILDLYMPHMSGLEVLEALRKDPKQRNVYAIMLSGMAGESAELASLIPQADRHLIKPIDADLLIATIHEGLERGEARGGLLGRLERR